MGETDAVKTILILQLHQAVIQFEYTEYLELAAQGNADSNAWQDREVP